MIPDLVCEIAFIDEPLTGNASATWVDVTPYLRDTLTTRRGRQHERDEIEAGRATIVLSNTDRRFDPNNASGPYFGDIQPMRKIRIGAVWSATTYWIFTGYVESWTPDYPGGLLATCTLECVDAMKYFNMIRVVAANRPQELSGARVDAVLDAVSWNASDRAVAVGDIDIKEMPIDATALSILQQTAATERGLFYISRSGNATFEDRSNRDAASSVDTWGDAADGSELPYSTISMRFDDSMIWNQIEITPLDGIKQTAFDTTSRDTYFTRTMTLPNLPYVDDTEALAAADLTLARYKDARTRLERMVIDPAVRDSWAEVLGRDLSDMITVRRSTLIDTAVAEFDAHIESIAVRIRKGLWEVTWQLSPHFTATPGTSTLSTQSIWIAPTLINSWVNYGGSETDAGYWKDADGWVHLRGTITNGTSGSVAFVLPVGYRPATRIRYSVSSHDDAGNVRIDTNGNVRVSDSQGAGVLVDQSLSQYVALDGSFRVI